MQFRATHVHVCIYHPVLLLFRHALSDTNLSGALYQAHFVSHTLSGTLGQPHFVGYTLSDTLCQAYKEQCAKLEMQKALKAEAAMQTKEIRNMEIEMAKLAFQVRRCACLVHVIRQQRMLPVWMPCLTSTSEPSPT
eukprot:354633-Chlamydomonas_euryale.AAC.3